jgi:hypothetical protein
MMTKLNHTFSSPTLFSSSLEIIALSKIINLKKLRIYIYIYIYILNTVVHKCGGGWGAHVVAQFGWFCEVPFVVCNWE